MNKRGISSLIAIMLLLGVTLTSASSAFFWLNKIQTQVSEDREHFEVVSFQVTGAEIGVLASNFEESSLTMFLKNTGEETVDVSAKTEEPTTVWLLKDINDKVICATDWSGTSNGPICEQGCGQELSPGELRKIILGNLNGICNVADKPEDSVFTYEIDFGGATKAEGSFAK